MGASKCASLSVICSEILKSIVFQRQSIGPLIYGGGDISYVVYLSKILNPSCLMYCVVGVFLTFCVTDIFLCMAALCVLLA